MRLSCRVIRAKKRGPVSAFCWKSWATMPGPRTLFREVVESAEGHPAITAHDSVNGFHCAPAFALTLRHTIPSPFTRGFGIHCPPLIFSRVVERSVPFPNGFRKFVPAADSRTFKTVGVAGSKSVRPDRGFYLDVQSVCWLPSFVEQTATLSPCPASNCASRMARSMALDLSAAWLAVGLPARCTSELLRPGIPNDLIDQIDMLFARGVLAPLDTGIIIHPFSSFARTR